MPILPIDFTIVSSPNESHLAMIESWMLWPNNERMRNEYFLSAAVAIGFAAKNQLGQRARDELLDLAVQAERLSQFQKLKYASLEKGLMAGNILIAALEGQNEQGGRLKRGAIDEVMAKLLAPQRGNNSSFVNTVWQQYRSVSHLWAAHVHYTENDYGRSFFSCELKDIIEFLWLSEEYRRKGESTKTTKNSPSTILPPDECVRIPDTMKFSKKDWNT